MSKLKALTIPKAPIEANTFDEICKLPRDSLSLKEFWLQIDVGRVSLAQQRSGESCQAVISIPRKDFDRLVRWYMTGKVRWFLNSIPVLAAMKPLGIKNAMQIQPLLWSAHGSDCCLHLSIPTIGTNTQKIMMDHAVVNLADTTQCKTPINHANPWGRHDEHIGTERKLERIARTASPTLFGLRQRMQGRNRPCSLFLWRCYFRYGRHDLYDAGGWRVLPFSGWAISFQNCLTMQTPKSIRCLYAKIWNIAGMVWCCDFRVE